MGFLQSSIFLNKINNSQLFCQAREAQRPIIESGQRMLESSTELLQNARKLASNPKDPPTWQVMTGVSRVLADAIKNLISTIRYELNFTLC